MAVDDGKKIAKTLQKRLGNGENKNDTHFLFATVVEINPWSIRTDDGLTITDEFIHISPFVASPAPKTKTLNHNHNGEVGADLIEVQLWEDTKVGDTVAVLNTNDAQSFILLWKVQNGSGVI